MSELDELILSWRRSLAELSAEQVEELEDHLRQQHAELVRIGLGEREAFAVAAMRCGRPSELLAQFQIGSAKSDLRHKKLHGVRKWLPTAIMGAGLLGFAVGIGLSVAGNWPWLAGRSWPKQQLPGLVWLLVIPTVIGIAFRLAFNIERHLRRGKAV